MLALITGAGHHPRTGYKLDCRGAGEVPGSGYSLHLLIIQAEPIKVKAQCR